MRRKIVFLMSSDPLASDMGVQMARMAISIGLDHDVSMIFKGGARRLLQKPTVFRSGMHNFDGESAFLDELEIPRYQYAEFSEDEGLVETDNHNISAIRGREYCDLLRSADVIVSI